MVHRPQDGSGTFATKAAAQASREYSATLSAIDSYLLDIEVPPSIIEKVKATPSNEIAFLAFEDVVRMERPPSIAEWLISGCGSLREDENEWIRHLHRFEEGQLYLTPQQVAYARRLENARDAVWSCEIRKIYGERKRLTREQPLRKLEYVLGSLKDKGKRSLDAAQRNPATVRSPKAHTDSPPHQSCGMTMTLEV